MFEDLGLQPLELDTLMPPSFNQIPSPQEVKMILSKTLVASKKQQKDKLKLDKVTGTLLSLESPLKTGMKSGLDSALVDKDDYLLDSATIKKDLEITPSKLDTINTEKSELQTTGLQDH